MGISVVAVAVVFLVVLMTVAAVMWRRRQYLQLPITRDPASPGQPTEPASDIHTIENELYEPYDKYAATDNTPTRHEDALQVIDNDLYEPFRR